MKTEQLCVGITRSVPGKPEIQGVCVKTLGEKKATREELCSFVSGLSALVTMYTDPVDDKLLDAAGDQLKIVCNFAVGFDNIDISACKKRGIIVCNTPDAVTEGTANLAWLLVSSCARRLIEADRYARSNTYPENEHLGMSDFLGMDLCNKVIHIVGAGRIGYATALRAKAFGMRVIYTARKRHLDFEMTPLGATRVSLDDGLSQADVVSIHTPLTDQTFHLINRENICLMKSSAILVNTSRGPVVDEAALAQALSDGKLWGAGLDVYENEPVIHPKLLKLDNVILTPHIGSAEIAWRHAMTEMVMTNVKAALENQEPPNRIA
ncbi:MAG: D-glycerate dehydrogenase [Phycisphaerales bacterium]|nr:D-glycerate dehydrogenase [Phycisphaerales bacterium]